SGALARDAVDAMVRRVASEFGKRVAPDAHQLIARRAGADTGMLASELEKLCVYVGERASIESADVRAVFRDMGEAWIFDFTGARAARRLGDALPLLRGLSEQGEPPLRLLAMISREIRLLLLARECLEGPLAGIWRGGLPFGGFQERVLPRIDAETRQA